MTPTTTALHPLLAARRSSRAFDERHELDEAGLTPLLEAARWAPSANNTQPWRFGVARRGEPAFDALVEALMPGNQVWAARAAALVLVAAADVDSAGRPLPWARYDVGQAVAHLTVQAQAQGLLVHDLRSDRAAARPDTPLSHPLELFWQGANHGGLWRGAFEPRSVLGLAVALGMVQRGA